MNYVLCGTCGNYIPDDEEHNAHHGIVPQPSDHGHGQCRDCQLWELHVIYDPHIPKFREFLKPHHQEIWDKMSFLKKCFVINKLVEKKVLTFSIG